MEALVMHADQRVDFVDAYLAATARAHGPRRICTKNVRDFRATGLAVTDR